MAYVDAKTRKNRAELKPFYVANGTTSAEIIAEARTSVRCVDTKRPFTPVESKRTLFGFSRRQENVSRPSSAFSIGPSHFTETDLPSTHRLQPLDVASDVQSDVLDDDTPVVIEADRKVKESLKASKNFERLPSPVIPNPRDGCVLPSPPSVFPAQLSTSRRSSTGNILKQKLVVNEGRRAQSGPSKRTSPKEETKMDYRASSSPCAHRQSSQSNDSIRNDAIAADRKKLSRLYKEHVRPILKKMEMCFRENDGTLLCELCNSLLEALKKVRILPDTKDADVSPYKSQILRYLFSFLGVKDSRLHLRLAKIVLQFDLSENNVENIFKLLFKVSRDENNDILFLEEEMTEILVSKISSFDGGVKYEPCLYSVGALKLISGNVVVRKHLVNTSCLEALAVVLGSIIKQGNANDVSLRKKNTNMLFPVTAVLRNLADVDGSRKIFLKRNILRDVINLLNIFQDDSDVVMNISRILSKMTLYSECCSVVSSAAESFETFLCILNNHSKSQEIVVRVLFVLGNLTTKSDDARFDLFHVEGSTKCLLTVFRLYFERDVKASKIRTEDKTSEQASAEDVLNKMVRVVANLSIHSDVGPEISRNVEFIELLLQVLEVKDLNINEELVLNTVATINNLSYYAEEGTALANKRKKITQLMMELLVADNMDAILEASRVFGNFSRFKDVRDILSSHKVDEMLISLLDSGSHEIVFTACGVLINMMVDPEKRFLLKDEGGIKKLTDVLRDYGKIDWQLAAMVCQTLWNYCENVADVYDALGHEETMILGDLLREYLGGCEETLNFWKTTLRKQVKMASDKECVDKAIIEKKHSGIPEATFLEDVDAFMKTKGKEGAESVIRRLDEQHQKYKFMEMNLLAKKRKLQSKIPDLKSTYEMVKVLKDSKKQDKTLRTQFLLSDQVYANASIPPTDKVCLWLGANVMLEYDIEEAEKLLSKNLEFARDTLQGVEDDLCFLKDQYVTTEVNMARVYNWDVTRRQILKASNS